MTAIRLHLSARTLLVALTLGGALGAVAALARPVSVPPTPRVLSRPPALTRRRTAVLRFTDRRRDVRFECTLDTARWRACRSPVGYGRLAPGPHRFAVRALSASDVPSAAARVRWRIGAPAPILTLISPRAGRYYSAAGWRAACPHGRGICGTLRLAPGLDGVRVAVQARAGGRWFTGRTYSGRHAVFLRALRLHVRRRRARSVRWSLAVPAPRPNGGYRVLVRTTLRRRRHTVTRAAIAVRFTVLATPPAPPVISAGPSSTSDLDWATLRFLDAEAGVRFSCRLDAGPWAPCASPITYKQMASAAHTFSVLATDPAGNASLPTVYTWAITSSGQSSAVSVSGTASGILFPGGPAAPITVTMTNPGADPVTVTAVAVSLDAGSLPSGCTAADYQIDQPGLAPGGVTLAPGASQAVTGDLRMLDTGRDQDACEGARLALSYAVSGP